MRISSHLSSFSGVKAKDAGVSQESLTYQLAKGALNLDLAMKQTAALNGILYAFGHRSASRQAAVAPVAVATTSVSGS